MKYKYKKYTLAGKYDRERIIRLSFEEAIF